MHDILIILCLQLKNLHYFWISNYGRVMIASFLLFCYIPSDHLAKRQRCIMICKTFINLGICCESPQQVNVWVNWMAHVMTHSTLYWMCESCLPTFFTSIGNRYKKYLLFLNFQSLIVKILYKDVHTFPSTSPVFVYVIFEKLFCLCNYSSTCIQRIAPS